ncbi:unnamed protein product [Xylocopa violacea]|uniref:Uncharacterized protein n=1 Tax=Xylocopa violacea TaxID=135666 RepID=A0ABP1NQQ5_XYLVO
MNELHLAIATPSTISIFIWFGSYFDRIQCIDIGTKNLIPFQSKGFIYLAVTGSTTLIFKYSLKFDEFQIMQRLPTSQDVSSFQFRKGHFVEHFLCLSTESSTVIYKEIHDRFVPFQQILSSKFIVPIISNKAIILLTLRANTIVCYQYDGWRFIELNTKLFGISLFHEVILYDKRLLLMKDIYDKWTLKQLVWIKQKSYKDFQEEIRVWNFNAKSIVQRIVVDIPNLESPIKIRNGHIDQLNVHNINRHNAQQLSNISKQYKELISKFEKLKIAVNNKSYPGNLTLASLRAKNVQVKCKTKCMASRLYVKENTDLLAKLTVPKDMNDTLSIDKLSVNEIKNWKCPLLSLPIEDISVNGLINGISLSYLQENALKVTGNQEVSGKHVFASVNATNAIIPLNIATNFTRQEVTMNEMRVKKLNLATGGILLPSNGPSTTITGSIKVPKLKIKNSVNLKGKPSGNGLRRLSPIIFISDFMDLYDNFTLENVKIENLNSADLIANRTGSVKTILANAISLHDNVTASLILSSGKLRWSNITLHGPQNFVTTNSRNVTVISGRKHFPRNLEITKFTYDNLKLPRIQTKLCATLVIAREIKTSTLTASNITVKHLTSSRVFGNLGERYFADDSTVHFKPVLPGKRYYHNIIVKNVTALRPSNLNLTELKKLANLWVEPNILNASIEAIELATYNLLSPVRFQRVVPKIIKNVILEQNATVDYINNINFIDFLVNAINIEDLISLRNITFHNDFDANYTHAFHLPLHLTDGKEDLSLYKKRISGNVIVNATNLPYSFKIIQNGTPVNIIVKGSATFSLEPTIIVTNNNRLEKMFTDIWFTTNATVFYGRNLHIRNVVIKGNVTLNNSSSTLNSEIWKNISKRALSKTKLQEIMVHVSLSDVEVPTIVGSNVSTIQSSSSDFSDIFENTLVKNKDQEVKAKWTFDTLKILGSLHLVKKINNMDLKKDVMRHDSERNIVIGKKTVVIVTAKSLAGYNFDKWANNALMQTKKYSIIKGKKKFNTITFNDIKVSGTIIGSTIEDALSKSANQTIYGQKKIQGFINASELSVNGLVNDVNLTELINRQLKKHEPFQRIKTGIEMRNTLNIIGNLIVKGAYAGVETKNFYKNYSDVPSFVQRMNKFSKEIEIINTALRNRAAYINKLEIVKDVNNALNKSTIVETIHCKSTNFSPHCINKAVSNVDLQTKSDDFILLKSIEINEEEFVVLIKYNSVSINLYDVKGNAFVHLKDLHIPNIMDAFVEPKLHSLWIILRLQSQTLVLHYQPWKDLQEYILPATDVFTISRSPNDQLLLLLSDGLWNLEGLASPRNIIGTRLNEKLETFADGFDYYVRCTSENDTTLMKARYAGN